MNLSRISIWNQENPEYNFRNSKKNRNFWKITSGITTWLTYQLHPIDHHLQSVPAPPKTEKCPKKKSLRKPAFSLLKIRRFDTQSFAYLTKGRYTYLFNSPRSQELFQVFPNQIYQLQDLHSKIVITNTPLFPLETGLWGQVLLLPIKKSKAANNGHRPQWPLTRSLPKSAFGRPVSRFCKLGF